MSDYAPNITPSDYTYSREVYFTNTDDTAKYNHIVKLILDSSTFNFDLAEEDGSDFRLTMYGDTLNMWIAWWSIEVKKAVIFFKIPVLPANRTVKFWAYWGNDEADNISDADEMNFYFAYRFSSTPLDSNIWTGYIDRPVTDYGYLLTSVYQSITTLTNPLEGVNSFRLEAGIYCNWTNSTSWQTNLMSFKFRFIGTENDFYYGPAADRAVCTAVDDAQTRDYYIGTLDYGLEDNSYNELTIDYSEPLDRVIIKLKNRNTYDNVEYYWPRKVEGDTRPQNFEYSGHEVGQNSGPNPNYISWVVIRDIEEDVYDLLDNTNLYIPYEYIPHQPIDTKEYGPDLTSVTLGHESDWGGDPTKLSDNGYDSDTNIWLSNDLATAEDYISLTINMAWASDVTDIKYTHYDSGHVYHYNAATLSDNDGSDYGWTYLNLTTTSGWAAIKFKNTKIIGAYRVKATSNLDAAPKDYVFYGSNYNPVIDFSKARILDSGTFIQSEDWQFRVLLHNLKYRYYILEVLNTHGGDPVEIQEWEMMESLQQKEYKFVTQLRLHPAIYGDLEYNFPKRIALLATNDGYNWDTLMNWTNTYTPFVEQVLGQGLWQLFSFINTNGYWTYKLLCSGNWGATDGRIAIGEWEMVELASEAYTYHVFAGSTNNITQIWAQDDCGLDDAYSLFFTTNDYLNRVANNMLVGTDTLPTNHKDFNVIQENY